MNESINYPFKSKYKYIKDTNIKTEPYIKDYQLKTVKKLSKPDFSFEPHCWEMDIMFALNKAYLVLINVNTKYLIVEPIDYKSELYVIKVIDKLVNKRNIRIETIKCDGEKAFISNAFKSYCNGEEQRYQLDKHTIKFKAPNKIKLIIDDSPFTNAHKCVDAVIRTLRNAFGQSQQRMTNNVLIQQTVEWYNNTPHASLRLLNPLYTSFDEETDEYLDKRQSKYIYLTPQQMQDDRDLEWQYIRAKSMQLKEIQQKQRFKGLLSYKPKNIILIHTDYGKTEKKHEKRRRVFNELAEFICYESGNVKCKLLNPLRQTNKTLKNKTIITVPIMYTKYVCSSIDALNDDYKVFFLTYKTQNES